MERCRHDIDGLSRFNETILGRAAYWWRQDEICESVKKYRTTCVPTGNGVGKSYLLAGLALGLALTVPGSKTIVAAPTGAQLSAVAWANIVKATITAEDPNQGLGFPLGGKFRGFSYEIEPEWYIEGWGSGSVEAKSGRHAEHLNFIGDEASGITAQVFEAADSLNASKYVLFGNPLRPEGKFYELCMSDNPSVNVIRIPSLESPDIDLPRSPRGMADRQWLDDSRWEYGEDSLWWKSHVLAQFPDEIAQGLLPIAWLNLAAKLEHARFGPVRLGVDLAKGLEGDLSIVTARDDRGVIESEWSNRWSLEQTAKRTAASARKHNVPAGRITFDATGLGTDFANRLAAEGFIGAREYMGSRSGGERFANLRSAAGWMLRRRLDPDRKRRKDEGGELVPQPPFALPGHLLSTFRKELQGIRYQLDDAGRIALEAKEETQKRLKGSPNFFDSLLMTFAYPHA